MNYRRLGGGVGVMRAPQTENYIWYIFLLLFISRNSYENVHNICNRKKK